MTCWSRDIVLTKLIFGIKCVLWVGLIGLRILLSKLKFVTFNGSDISMH